MQRHIVSGRAVMAAGLAPQVTQWGARQLCLPENGPAHAATGKQPGDGLHLGAKGAPRVAAGQQGFGTWHKQSLRRSRSTVPPHDNGTHPTQSPLCEGAQSTANVDNEHTRVGQTSCPTGDQYRAGGRGMMGESGIRRLGRDTPAFRTRLQPRHQIIISGRKNRALSFLRFIVCAPLQSVQRRGTEIGPFPGPWLAIVGFCGPSLYTTRLCIVTAELATAGGCLWLTMAAYRGPSTHASSGRDSQLMCVLCQT